LATVNPSTEVQNINYSQCAPLQQVDYFELYQEWRVKSVSFRIIYPGEQDIPLCSVEMAYLPNQPITDSAAPATMLLSNFDDYCVSPIPTSHMIEGTVSLSAFMRSREATWSKWNSNDYYGKVASTNTPLFLIRTNFFGTTTANQLYA